MNKIAWLTCFVFVASQMALAGMPLQEDGKKKKRVKRPTFDKTDSVYFKNLFSDALIGERPARGTGPQLAKKGAGSTGQESSPEASGELSDVWDKLITAEMLQTELKSLSNELTMHVTSPSKFKSGGNRDIRQACSLIGVMFGVIAEYNGDVKWKDIAPAARDAFSQCAQSSTTTSTQAYQQAKNRKEDLQQILSGGPFTPPVKPAEDFEWASVADLGELMKRLKTSYRERIKPLVGSPSEYKANIDDLMREAAVVAVIAEVLQNETMENADNDDYVEFAQMLQDGAKMILDSKVTMDVDMASKGAGMMDQSCTQCHGEYN